MRDTSNSLTRFARAATLLACLGCAWAQADEYSEVSQLIRSGNAAQALDRVDKYLANKPRDPQMRFLRGVIQRDAGKTSEAIATFTRLTEEFPELPEPYNNLAVLYAGQGQFDKARGSLEMAIQTNPSYATAHENLGDVYAKLASQAYNKALQLDGSNEAVAPKLALIRELFNPAAGKGQRPATPASAPAASTTAAAGALVGKPAAIATAPAASPAVKPVIAAAAQPAAVPVPATKAAPPAPDPSAARQAEAAVRAWASAWSAKDVPAYLAAYGAQFDPPGKLTRSAWEEERRQRITGKTSISVKLEDLNITVEGDKARARFRQDYRANGLAVTSRKTLELQKAGNRWQIVRESNGG
jgi:tetratricopeptide (TPR) repeat protein